MTMALCLNCGTVKFGAICPCPRCSVASTDNIQMDIAFSDHHLPLKKLEELGGVLKRIAKVCGGDAQLRGMSFLAYVTDREPGILRIELKPEHVDRVKRVLEQADQLGPLADDPLPGAPTHPPPPPPPPPPRRWWQFWRS
jgi:hypothetical protein